jgi:V-type H+-transporting ATPase subunit C
MAFRFIVRDFVYSEDAISKQQEELALADVTEKELWVCPHSLSTSI